MKTPRRRILFLDGGGIKGAFPTSFLTIQVDGVPQKLFEVFGQLHHWFRVSAGVNTLPTRS